MGGVYGHMPSIWEDISLTFGKIKRIFIDASGGNLLVSEKTDGINIYLSYSVKEGKAKAARNQSNIKLGGLDAEQLASKFIDRGQLTTSFNEAFSTWEAAIKQLNPQTQIKIFGPNTNVYYSAEIIGPDSKNVINYEIKSLVLHSSGHFLNDVDEKSFNIEEGRKILQNTIQQIQQSKDLGSYKIINQSIFQLRKLDDKKPLESALFELSKLQNKFNLKDSHSIGDFVKQNIENYLKENFPKLSSGVIQNLIDKTLGVKGLNINKILEKVPQEYKEKIKLLSNNINELNKQSVLPLENIIYKFSIELLKGINSLYILDNSKSLKQLQSEVSDAIQKIQNSSHEEAIKILNQQLNKLQNADQINTSIEGLVFEFEGTTYKFTGNFAPINQILGLFKYGRGSTIPPLNKFIKESTKNRIIAMFPGAFKPPHNDHFLAVKKLNDISNVDEIIIIISQSNRFDNSKKLTITPEQSLRVWKIYSKYLNKIKPEISPTPSPVTSLYDKMKQLNPGDTLILLKGVDDKEGDTRFKRAQEWAEKNNLNIKLDYVYNEENNIHSSELRELLANDKKEEFKEFLPKVLSNQEKETIWHILTINKSKMTIKENTNNNSCFQFKKKLNLKENNNLPNEIKENNGLSRSVIIHALSKQFIDSARINEKDPGVLIDDPNLIINYIEGGWEDIDLVHINGRDYDLPDNIQDDEKLRQEVIKSAVNKLKNRLYEMSSMGAGSVQGSISGKKMKGPWINNKFDESLFINRNSFLEELKLREVLKKAIIEINKKQTNELNELKKVIRKNIKESFLEDLILILKEGKTKTGDINVHPSTGINVLEDLLKKIIPSLEQDYKILTTSPEQRESFRSHILNAVSKTLTTADINQQAGDSIVANKTNLTKENILPPLENTDTLQDNIDVTVDPENNEKFIDIDKKEDNEEVDTFTIAGKDTTGRNMAQMAYDKMEKNIIDSYEILSDPKDKQVFYDFLLTNLKLYLDRFESEMESDIKEPEVSASPKNTNTSM